MCAKHKRGTSIGIGVVINFRNLNTDFETETQTLEFKVKVTGVKILACMERLFQGMCVPNIYGIEIL